MGIQPIGMFRLYTSTCYVDKPFVHNDKFKVIKGEEYYEGGLLNFPLQFCKPDLNYRTFTGPTVAHSGCIYARNDHNAAKALTRQTGKREADKIGLDEALVDAQLRNMRAFLDLLTPLLTPYFTLDGDHYWSMQSYVELPNSKRALRRQMWLRIIDGRFYSDYALPFLEGKVKAQEWAKPGKYPRLFVNLGPASPLKAGYIVEHLKHLFPSSGPVAFVAGPTRELLLACFKDLITPSGLVFRFFSDDSCASYPCSDGVGMANVDISGCDASHTSAPFRYLEDITRGTLYELPMHAAVAQCRKPIMVRSYARVRKPPTVVLKPNTPVLYSGSVLTTLVNNLANWAIGQSLQRLVFPGMTKRQFYDAIPRAAAAVGYIVTVDECQVPEELQFLKHSPCFTEAGVTPIINLGVILRLLGSCHGDLPGRGDILRRAHEWHVALVQSLVHAGDHDLLRTLRAKFPGKVTKAMQDHLDRLSPFYAWRFSQCGMEYIPAEGLGKRYGLSGSHILEMCRAIEQATWGDIICTYATKVILAKDYGL